MSGAVHEVKIPLSFPIPVKGSDGRDAKRDLLVMRRPKTRHAKQLAAICGADLLQMIAEAPDGEVGQLDKAKIAADLAKRLVTIENLDAFTAIVADMCNEEPEVIDELDVADLIEVAKGFADFFPSLQSFVSTT
jgi:hypothetical protein